MYVRTFLLAIVSSGLISTASDSTRTGLRIESGFEVSVNETATFERLLAFEAIPEWNSSVLSSQMITSGAIEVGSRFVEVRKRLFRTSEMTFEVLGLAPGKALSVEGRADGKTILFEFQLSRGEDRTRVDLTYFEPGMPWLLRILLKPIYQLNVDANMRRLRLFVSADRGGEHGRGASAH